MAVEKRFEVYKCSICGNIVEVLVVGGGTLVCCGKPMERLTEKTEDKGMEKHVPVVEDLGNSEVKVKVGSVQHPMEENHYIEWIEAVTDRRTYIKFLKPGEAPEAEFYIDGKLLYVREHCNLHGLWKKTT